VLQQDSAPRQDLVVFVAWWAVRGWSVSWCAEDQDFMARLLNLDV
jgi:hypothetical protein